MRLSPPLALVFAAVAAAGVLLGPGVAGAERRAAPAGNRGPLRDLADAKTRASSPIDLQALAGGDLGGLPSPAFDPAKADQIDVIRNGHGVAWTTNLSELGIPGASRDVILFREGKKTRDRVSDAAGDNDQPSVGFDSFGVRLAWRGSDGVRGTTPGNVWVRSTKIKFGAVPADGGPAPKTEEVVTKKITNLVTAPDPNDAKKIVGTAYDPSLCARTRSRDVGGGIKVKERDARVAFVSTGDLVKGRNTAGRPQLFVWREQDSDFVQITSIAAGGFQVNRPSISSSGARIAFECSADLTPLAADPRNGSLVGNPSGVRQIYLWDAGRGVEQLTWSDRDCLAPRISRDGRFVVFCSRGDLIPGGNPEGNFEIFAWVQSRDATLAVRQMTQTALGDSVLPRPGRSPEFFAFWSTATPAGKDTEFGSGTPNLLPLAYVRRPDRVDLVGGWTDAENGTRLLSLVPGTPAGTAEYPVFCGPPAIVGDPGKAQFVTNDISMNTKNADDDLDGKNGGLGTDGKPLPDDRAEDASILSYHVARSTPRAGRSARK